MYNRVKNTNPNAALKTLIENWISEYWIYNSSQIKQTVISYFGLNFSNCSPKLPIFFKENSRINYSDYLLGRYTILNL